MNDTPSPFPSDVPSSISGDHYPAALVGRPITLQSGAGSPLTLARIGLPERLLLPTQERLLAIVGDRVVTTTESGSGSQLRLWSFATGEPIGDPTPLPAISEPIAAVAGSEVLLWADVTASGTDDGLIAFSTVDRSIRTVIGPTRIVGLEGPTRRVIVSQSGTQVAMSVCASGIDSVGDCRPTRIVDIATGKVLRSLDLGGRQVTLLTDTWLLVGDNARTAMLGSRGAERWSTGGFGQGATVWGQVVTADGRLIAEIRSLGDFRPVLITVDPASGAQAVLYRPSVGVEWHFWPELSTDRLLAIGYDAFLPPCMDGTACGPDDPHTIDAATLDAVTGTLTPHAISITFSP